jgi:hypothetical protein
MCKLRNTPSYHGLNRRVARKLGISDALVCDVLAGRRSDRHGIKKATAAERRLMREELSACPDKDVAPNRANVARRKSPSTRPVNASRGLK